VINRLEDGFKRLSKKNFVEMNLDASVPLRDAAKYFNYSQDYLRNLINKGKLPAKKRGKLWYLKIRDVEHYIKNLSAD
jgi:excisionase family DNA binding protein